MNKIKNYLYGLMIKIDVNLRLSCKLNKIKTWLDVKRGYKDVSGKIIKCKYCKSKGLEYYNEIINSGWCSVIEKKVLCRSCGKFLGCYHK